GCWRDAPHTPPACRYAPSDPTADAHRLPAERCTFSYRSSMIAGDSARKEDRLNRIATRKIGCLCPLGLLPNGSRNRVHPFCRGVVPAYCELAQALLRELCPARLILANQIVHECTSFAAYRAVIISAIRRKICVENLSYSPLFYVESP